MKQQLLIFSLFTAFSLQAQTPIFSPGMSITALGSYSSPAGEGVENIIDNDVSTKYLDFNDFDGFGFTVNTATTTSSYVATRIDITTANDSEERDPTIFEVLGSNDGTTFTAITSGTIPCVSARFFTRTFNFTNTNAYSYYRVNFTNQCNTIEQMFQLSEVQLFGDLLSINSFAFNSNTVKVAPNPSNGNFVVSNSGSENINKITVIDALGKIVKEQVFTTIDNHHEVTFSGVLSGIYFVKIASNDKEIIKKLIVN